MCVLNVKDSVALHPSVAMDTSGIICGGRCVSLMLKIQRLSTPVLPWTLLASSVEDGVCP